MPHHDSQQNPYGSHYQGASFQSARYAPRPSALAILSLIAGLVSFPMMCLLFLCLPFSIFAIVSGHMARGAIRTQPERYAGTEMATVGMLSGYTTLLLMGGGLLIFTLAATGTRVVTVSTPARTNAGQTLMEDARAQLMNGNETASFGVSTSNHDANSLARHFIESLHVRDEIEFNRAGESEDIAPRAYRVYVRLNSDSVACLVRVPEFERFTDEARETLFDACWTIAQRSVDHILPPQSNVAVGVYSGRGLENAMTGRTTSGESADAGNRKQNRKEKVLAAYFKVPDRKTRPASVTEDSGESSIVIDVRRDTPELPAEVE